MLPAYVYDLIAAVQQFEDEHGDTSMCFGHALNAVPQQERDRAAAIAHYQSDRLRRERTLEDEAPGDPYRRIDVQPGTVTVGGETTGGPIPGGLTLVGEVDGCVLQPPAVLSFRCGLPGCLGRHAAPNEVCG